MTGIKHELQVNLRYLHSGTGAGGVGAMDNESTRRQSERLPGVFQVRFKVNGDKGDGVVVDLTAKGMRLRTTLEGSTESIQMSGEVVYLLTQQPAEEVGAAPGIGVRIGSIPPPVKERFTAFIKMLENRYQN